MTGLPRSHGRKSARPRSSPAALMEEPGAPTPGVWTARVVTLYPETFPGVLGASLTGRALAEGLWRLETVDLRRFGVGRHRAVDDTPVGGGPGMVLRPDVLAAAITEAAAGTSDDVAQWPRLVLSPRGRRFSQADAQRWAGAAGVTLVCGRFEGIDERAVAACGLQEISLGDFVLTGGEIAAQALIDATVRLIPSVLGNQASVEEESFSTGLLEHPQYTKPVDWAGRRVPDILLSGHHGDIAAWRRAEAERLTRERRPDLWRAYRAARDGSPDEDREL